MEKIYAHEYATKKCQHCKTVFCYGCCGDQNVDQGRKYEADFMLCPKCGQDWYQVEPKQAQTND